MTKRNWTDRTIFTAFMLGIAFIAFIGGVASLRYMLPPGFLVDKGFAEAEVWLHRENKEAPPASTVGVEYAISNSKTSWDKNYADAGYTLLTLRYSTTAYLLDMDGRVVHRWSLPFSRAWSRPPHIERPASDERIYLRKAKLFPNGDLIALYEAMGELPYGYGIVKMDKDSKVLWTFPGRTHHELSFDSEGNIYTIVHALIKQPIQGLEGLPNPILSDAIFKLSPDGKKISAIPLPEAFRDSPYASLLYHTPKNAYTWDHFHTNSVRILEPAIADKFPMFKSGQLLVSMRNMNTIAVIDPETRKVVWALSGPWRAQHAAQFLDNGNILLLDNKGYVFDGQAYSRAIEINPATNAITWSFAGSPRQPFYTESYGDVQRLPNGNTLIASSYGLRVFEVALNGAEVWSYQLPSMTLYPADRLIKRDKPPAPAGNISYEEEPDENANQSAIVTSAKRYPADDLTFLKK